MEYLSEAISNSFRIDSIEGTVWFFLTAYSKIWEERNDLKTELLIKREAELKALENSKPIYIGRSEKVLLEENTKCGQMTIGWG